MLRSTTLSRLASVLPLQKRRGKIDDVGDRRIGPRSERDSMGSEFSVRFRKSKLVHTRETFDVSLF
jgi:hypothetical protein